MYIVEKLIDGQVVPVGCADSMANAMIMLGPNVGIISTVNKTLIVSNAFEGKR